VSHPLSRHGQMHFVAVAGDVNAHQKHIVERVHSERGTIRRIAVAVPLDQFGRPRRLRDLKFDIIRAGFLDIVRHTALLWER